MRSRIEGRVNAGPKLDGFRRSKPEHPLAVDLTLQDLLAFALEPVAVAAQHEHLSVMHEAVDQSGNRHRVAEDLGPAGEGLVRAHDDRAALVAA